MASPPYGGATSPPAASPLALPRQRPSLALPAGIKSRKPSLASNTSSAHPLRQTSFPPPDSLEAQHAAAEDAKYAAYSPSAEGSLDDFSDTEIQSAISGPAGVEGLPSSTGKRRRPGEKRARGRPPKHGMSFRNASMVNGEGSAKKAGATSVVMGDGDAEAEPADSDEEEGGPGAGGRVPLYAGGELSTAEIEEQHERQRMFYETVPQGHTERYDSYLRAKLRTADVRRLVNQTLSQSVPANVVLVVSAYTKMFAGMLVEGAREVQAEWEAVEEKTADGSDNRAFKRLKQEHDNAKGEHAETQGGDSEDKLKTQQDRVKPEPTSSTQMLDVPDANEAAANGSVHNQKTDQSEEPPLFLGGAGGLSRSIAEPDRGPLLPDHLREALRRYKKARAGGSVGFTGLSLQGREVAAARMGGRRLFR